MCAPSSNNVLLVTPCMQHVHYYMARVRTCNDGTAMGFLSESSTEHSHPHPHPLEKYMQSKHAHTCEEPSEQTHWPWTLARVFVYVFIKLRVDGVSCGNLSHTAPARARAQSEKRKPAKETGGRLPCCTNIYFNGCVGGDRQSDLSTCVLR